MDQKNLDRAPIKDLRVKSPSYGVRTPQLLMSREAGEFEKGDILDANTTTELVNSVIEAAGNNDAIVALTNKVNTAINDDGSINVQGRTNVQGGINIPSIEFVDLGLPSGTLWMKCNIGAEKETDYGLYFQWGDTVGYEGDFEFTWSNCPGNGGNSYYNEPALSTWGTTNLTNGVLNTSVDAAYAHTKGKAKMPTRAQFHELNLNTNNEWVTIDGVKGVKFTNKNDSSKYIFIPASGCRDESYLDCRGDNGYYWSSTLNSDFVSGAYRLGFSSSGYDVNSYHRYYGLPVRGVASTDPVKLTLPSASGTLALISDIEEKEAALAQSINDLNTRITNLETTINNLNAQAS